VAADPTVPYGTVISLTFGNKPYVAMVIAGSIGVNYVRSDEGTCIGDGADGLLVLGLSVPPADQVTYHQQYRTATRLCCDTWGVIE
jgi:hypothetical protein